MQLLGRFSSGSPAATAAAGAVSVVVALTSGCGGAARPVVQATEVARPASVAEPAAFQGVLHAVQPGQTLWRIARVYGVPLEQLAADNAIADPTSLEIGRVLRVRGAARVLEVPSYPAPMPVPDGSPSFTNADADSLFDWPLPGRVLSGFDDPRRRRRHQGIDIRGNPGQPVRAAQAGRVIYSGSTLRGYGKTIIIEHGDELHSLYAHNSKLLASEGDHVERGQAIARVGRTGNATTEHCHFEIRRNDVPVDPRAYLPRRTDRRR